MNTPGLLTDAQLNAYFKTSKKLIEALNSDACMVWSIKTISEVNLSVRHSLEGKFKACSDKGYNAAKIGGTYTFWISKLKPAFALLPRDFCINEYIALHAGFAYVRERTQIIINLSRSEMCDICDTLRFHTSSPHTLTHIFELWIARENLKSAI